MSEVLLKVEKRNDIGKKLTKHLRNNGRIPAIYYLHGQESIPVSCDEKEFRAILHSDSSIIDLHFEDGKKAKTVVRDVQWHPVTTTPLHVDFMGVKLTEKIQVTLPVHFSGTAVGVKQNGGILQPILRELDIQCLPLDIPEHYEIDISDLDIGDSIKIEELSIDKVEILNEPQQTIVTVMPPIVEEVVEEEEGIEGEEGAEPEVVGDETEDSAEEDSEGE